MMENDCRDGEKTVEQNIASQFNSPDTSLIKKWLFQYFRSFFSTHIIDFFLNKKTTSK